MVHFARYNWVIDHFFPLEFRYMFEGNWNMHCLPVGRSEPPACTRFESNHTYAILNCSIQNRLSNASIVVRREIDWKHASIYQAAFDHSNSHGLGMSRKSNGSNLPLQLGSLKRFHRPSLSQYPFHVPLCTDGMELIQIQMIRLQRFQSIGQIVSRPDCISIHCLGCQKHVVAIGFQCRTEAFLRYPVSILWGNVEVRNLEVFYCMSNDLVR
mmetsp:Transcript_6720/g.11947  ORF Transcript_6720/g.11947 Transcript_6720/m.11947 type:complete len:212 (+) Transcript_6720:373-1008(+)